MKLLRKLRENEDTKLFLTIIITPFIVFYAADYTVLPLIIEVYGFSVTYSKYKSISKSVHSGRYLAISIVNLGSKRASVLSSVILLAACWAIYHVDFYFLENASALNKFFLVLMACLIFVHGRFAYYIGNVILTDEYLNLQPIGIKAMHRLNCIESIVLRKDTITIKAELSMNQFPIEPKAMPHLSALVNALKGLLGEKVRYIE